MIEQFRIGNYFGNIEDDSIYKVTNIENEIESLTGICINEMGWQNQTHFHTIDQVVGIPINNDWLVKFGFVKMNSFIDKPTVHKDYYIFVNTNTNEVMLSNLTLPHIQFVHQLQNLYFILSNKELSLNK